MKKRAIVTGGAGFIGSNVVQKLIAEKWHVIVIDNLSTGYLENIKNLDIEFHEVSITNYKDIESKFKNVDVVFHLAASVGRQRSIDYPVADSEINIIGTINVLEAMRNNGVKRIVYSSSAAIYGELMGEEIDESHQINPNCQYGVSKLAAEKMVISYHFLYGFEVFALRYFNIFGLNQRYDFYGNVIPIFTEKMSKNLPITIYGDGMQTRDFIDVRDVAIVNYLAATSNRKFGIYNIGTGESIKINFLAEAMKDILKSETNTIYSAERIGDVKHCKADISKAKRELNFNPSKNFLDNLRDYVEWYIGKKV